MGFLVLRIWPILDGFFPLRTQKLQFFGFSVFCSLWFLLFLSIILVFGFRQKSRRFFGFGIRGGFRFFALGFRFLFGNFNLDYVPQPCVKTLSTFPLFIKKATQSTIAARLSSIQDLLLLSQRKCAGNITIFFYPKRSFMWSGSSAKLYAVFGFDQNLLQFFSF